MKTEIEVKFLNIHINEIRAHLENAGAKLVKPMALMRRMILKTPEMLESNAMLRLRDEGDKKTLTYKKFTNNTIDGAKEIEIKIDDFETTADLLIKGIGVPLISFQESKRETWVLNNVEIMIDKWPWLDPYIEIEGTTENEIQTVALALGQNWEDRKFGSVTTAYIAQYPHLCENDIISLPEFKFDSPLPDIFKSHK